MGYSLLWAICVFPVEKERRGDVKIRCKRRRNEDKPVSCEWGLSPMERFPIRPMN